MIEQSTKEEVLKLVNSKTNGLEESEVELRLKREGLNELEQQKKDSFIKKFYNQVKSPLIIILLFSSIISQIKRKARRITRFVETCEFWAVIRLHFLKITEGAQALP